MPKRPDTLETVLMALELLRRIPRSSKISAPELCTQLSNAGIKRDLRTIQRQLEMLSEHFDIERDDRNKPYGYKWKERAQGIAMPTLNEQESLLLLLAYEHLKNLLPARLLGSMKGFFEQAGRNLGPDSNRKLEKQWLNKVRVVSETQPLLPPKVTDGVFEEVSNALYANRWLNLDYKNSNGKLSQIEVMPLGLAQQGVRMYLVCRYKGFENERSLALHRILKAQASAHTFDPPKDFDLKQYDDDGRFGFGEGKKIKLSFKISKFAGAHLLETPLSKDQEVLDLGDDYLISATVIDSAQLDWWLRGFGDEVIEVKKKSYSITD